MREAAGERFPDIELNVRAFFVSVTDDRSATLDRRGLDGSGFDAGGRARPRRSPSSARAGQIADDLDERRERWGFSYVIVGAEDVDAFAPVVAELAGT